MEDSPAKENPLLELIAGGVPHHHELGFEALFAERGTAVSMVPYSDKLIGNPETRVLHGGVVTSLLDATGGLAVLSAMTDPKIIATLDLRIDYLKPSVPGEPVYAKVECYKLTFHVAFARGVAYNRIPEDPLASVTATYML
jgi:uncharacterized protein (TIGR00369 family)